jgi:predicted O-methyltransferase YrrM
MKFLSEALQAYVAEHCPSEPPLLAELRRETHLKILYPQMISSAVQGRWLAFLSKLVSPTRILEIGAFTGYSTLCLAEGLAADGTLVSIEQHPEREALIRKYVGKAGFSQQLDLRIGDAAALLPEVTGLFDLVFLDADKGNYPLYFELVVPLLRPGGLLIADNVLWHGHVLSERQDKETLGIQGFNAAIMADERVEGIMMGMEDGLFLVRRV